MFSPESVLLGATQKKMVGSVMFFQADSIEEVKKSVESDIYYTSGVVSLVNLASILMWRIGVRVGVGVIVS